MAEQKPATSEYLETPRITVEAGYRARLLVPPGTFYDPLFPIAGASDDIWLNDDGGEEEAGGGGGGIYCVDRDGEVTPLVPVGKIPPPTGYCYSSRIIYADRDHWNGNWVDLYDSNKKLWKAISYYNDAGDVPGLGSSWDGVASAAMDFQNSHETVWCGFGNPWKRKPFLDNNAPKEYLDGVKYGSPGGLMMIMR
jgi:hypothetical protein